MKKLLLPLSDVEKAAIRSIKEQASAYYVATPKQTRPVRVEHRSLVPVEHSHAA